MEVLDKRRVKSEEDADQVLNTERLRELVPHIKGNAHFKTIVRAADPKMRAQVYDLLAPMVTNFKVVKFHKLWAYE